VHDVVEKSFGLNYAFDARANPITTLMAIAELLKITKIAPQLQNCNWKKQNPGCWSDWVWSNRAEMI
jgi:hypothetical protein